MRKMREAPPEKDREPNLTWASAVAKTSFTGAAGSVPLALAGAGHHPRVIRDQVERALLARLCRVARDCQGQLGLDASEDVVLLDDHPCNAELLDLRQGGVALLTGAELICHHRRASPGTQENRMSGGCG